MATHTSISKVTIDAPAERVWDALTKPELVKQWQYGSDLITDWRVGSPIRFRTEWEGSVLEQWGTVTSFLSNERLSYTLFAPRPGLEDKPENYFTMTYCLLEHDSKTTLTVTQEDPRERPSDEAAPEEPEGENPILQCLKRLVEDGAR